MKNKNNSEKNKLTIVKGNLLTIERGILVHQVNTLGVMGGGIALQIREKWPILFERYAAKCKKGELKLGQVDVFEISPDLYVVNLAGQESTSSPDGVDTNYASYEESLPVVRALGEEKGLPVYFPHGIGCGLAGGDWSVMEPLLHKHIPEATLVQYTPPPVFTDPVLVLRTCDKDFKSYGGFQWPREGYVEAPDFRNNTECGHGLHGLLDGWGNLDLLDWGIDAVAMVVETDRSLIIDLGDKVKFPCGYVKKTGTLAALIGEFRCDAAKIKKEVEDLEKTVGTASHLNSQSASGDDSQLSASGWNSQLSASGWNSQLSASGDDSQLSASGDDSQLSASGWNSQLSASGNRSQLSASGDDSKLSASGDDSKLSASGDDSQLSASGWNSQLSASGNRSQLSASGNRSKLSASGDDSQLSASGDDSQLSASGDDSQLSASGWNSQLSASGNRSKLSASGNRSKLSASGDDSQLSASGWNSQLSASGKSSLVVGASIGCVVSAGENGALVLSRWVEGEKRYRVTVAYVGENGIKADTNYRLNEAGEFEEVA
jgi:O-acetyl-ADP-ribose deacetylase (regulator of RNase III)